MRFSPLLCVLLTFATLSTTACGSSEPGGSECENASECEIGEVCTDNACVSSSDTTGDDATDGTDDGGEEDAGDDGTTVDVADAGDDSGADADTAVDGDDDAGDDADAGQDADVENDGASFPTLADYRACDSDIDCPVGLGNCITELPLNRPDPVLGSRVAIADIAPGWPRAGVCSLSCSNEPSLCDTLELRDSLGRPVPFSCQLIIEGASPYPTSAPPFPFDDTLDAEALAAGVAFGAMCRPPFGLDDANSDTFCFSCDGNETCGDGDVCWDFAGSRTAEENGVCLMACNEDVACPLGFSCDELSQDDGDGPTVLGTFCAPLAQTCGDCRDFDGDRRGVGLCGAGDELVSAVDCDDRDPGTYHSATDPAHGFPEMCGEFDVNCNGLSDASEQVGADAFPEEHCTACGDVCSGVEPNATLQCQTDIDTEQPLCAVVCDDPSAFADCTDEPGCETPVDDPTRLFYRDADEDGAGDPDDFVFACELGEAPEGYVSNDADCDDDAPNVFGAFGETPASAEVCDGVDNNCDGGIDTGIDEVGDFCNTDNLGICRNGTFVCNGEAGLSCVSNIAPGTQEEICDNQDNDCDGEEDEPEDIVGLGDDCTADGELGVCAAGTTVCDAREGALICEPGEGSFEDFPDALGLDTNCDGIDGNSFNAIFVSPGGSDTNDGTASNPVRTLERAVSLARGGLNQILMNSGEYEADETIEIARDVSIFGGYERGADDSWQRNFEQARIVATLPPSTELALAVSIDSNAAQSVNLGWLDIEANTAGGVAGQSVAGLRCDGCSQSTFTSVNITAGPAEAGGTGDGGTGGDNGFAGNDGEGIAGSPSVEDPCHGTPISIDVAGAGGDGAPGGTVAASSQAGFNGAGSSSLRGAGGASAGISTTGRDGGDADEVSSVQSAADGGANSGTPDPSEGEYQIQFGWMRPSGRDGRNGSSGAGGGGGSGGGQTSLGGGARNIGAGGASGGTAGCGGTAGDGGTAGGSSIGMILRRSNGITFSDVTVTSGAGGAGGRGGQGGLGGNGGAGGTAAEFEGLRDGGDGGAGSGGSGGGGGGGGAGGSSFALLRDDATGVGGGISLSAGTAGAAGAGGSGGMGGQHGDLIDGEQSVSGPAGLPGAPGQSLQQRVY